MRLESREPAHRQLDQALARFADAALAGDEVTARAAFVDALAFVPSPRELLEDARGWVFAEQQMMAGVSDRLSDRAAQALLASARGRGGRR